MGSYAYCQHKDCEAGLSQPTLREAVEGKQTCRNGHENPLQWPQDALASALEDLAERVEALENAALAKELMQ